MVVCLPNLTLSHLLTFLVILSCMQPTVQLFLNRKVTDSEIRVYREKVIGMFYHAYDNYMNNAYPYDELRPLSCDGVDTWGSFSLTLIDALDTLAVMGNYSEFRRVAQLITEKANFDMNINVSVFETNIRVVGGLLSAHLLSYRAGMPLEPGWPCSGPMLRLAEELGHRLLPAFDSDTGMPYGTVNLRHGVPVGETPITCTAGVATFIVEFGTLSRLTGNPSFENAALRALNTLWRLRSPLGLVGNHVDVMTGKWTAVDSGIGAGVDSYYEYLVKGSILLQKPQLMDMFNTYYKVINKYMVQDDWYMWVNMQKGQVTLPVFQSLEAYWPGLLTLIGNIDAALKTVHNYHQVWKQYGFTPEFYNIPQSEPNNNREGYPLRPELVESLMYLYKATKDPIIFQMGVDILESIQHSAKTKCGYASIKDVRNHVIEDRMESFFLAETTKYLYLLFDPDNFVHSNGSTGTVIQTSHGECIIDAGGYIFNTEAHPIDAASVYCCSAAKEEDALLQNFHDNMDLLALLKLDDGFFLKPFPKLKSSKNVEELKPLQFDDTSVGTDGQIEAPEKLSLAPLSPKGESQSTMEYPSVADWETMEVQTSSPVVEASSEDPIWQNEISSKDYVVPIDYVHEASDQETLGIQSRDSDRGARPSSDTSSSEPSTDNPSIPYERRDEVPDSIGVGRATFLGHVAAEPVVDDDEPIDGDVRTDEGEDDSECSDDGDDGSPSQAEVDEQKAVRTAWSGTKPFIGQVRRDTLQPYGFSGASGIGLMGLDRNESVAAMARGALLRTSYEVLTCPAQPFTLRLSIMGEMFGVN